jgi:hypothetical protein
MNSFVIMSKIIVLLNYVVKSVLRVDAEKLSYNFCIVKPLNFLLRKHRKVHVIKSCFCILFMLFSFLFKTHDINHAYYKNIFAIFLYVNVK